MKMHVFNAITFYSLTIAKRVMNPPLLKLKSIVMRPGEKNEPGPVVGLMRENRPCGHPQRDFLSYLIFKSQNENHCYLTFSLEPQER